LGEWGCELVARRALGVDLDPLEESLVDESAFGGVGVEIGGLDVVCELERDVEGPEDGVIVEFEAAE